MYMCTYTSFFAPCRYVSLSAIVKFRIGSPKRLGTNKIVPSTSRTGSIAFEGMLLGSSLPAWRREAVQMVLKFTDRLKIGISTP